MSGGLTLSGGEPLMQDRFVVKLSRRAQAMGIHTALDTNGYLGDRLSDAELETIDLVMLDIKTWDAERHRHLTGMDNAPTLAFARRLARASQTDVGALRAGARPDRRSRRTSRRSRRLPPSSATSSASTCCRSIRWAASSGNSSASTTRSRTPSRRPWKPLNGRAPCSATLD